MLSSANKVLNLFAMIISVGSNSINKYKHGLHHLVLEFQLHIHGQYENGKQSWIGWEGNQRIEGTIPKSRGKTLWTLIS